jgi:predicted nuclease with TOPRIM domain
MTDQTREEKNKLTTEEKRDCGCRWLMLSMTDDSPEYQPVDCKYPALLAERDELKTAHRVLNETYEQYKEWAAEQLDAFDEAFKKLEAENTALRKRVEELEKTK